MANIYTKILVSVTLCIATVLTGFGNSKSLLLQGQREFYQSGSCSDYLYDSLTEFFKSDVKNVSTIEVKNGLIYIDKNGFLDLTSGKILDPDNVSHRESLYKILGDSVICLRTEAEQYIFNLLSGYQYFRKKWKSGIFRFPDVMETYSGSIIPVFENDSALLIVELKSNRILKKISGGRYFHKSVAQNASHLFLGNNKYIYKINKNDGRVELEVKLKGGLSSDIIVTTKSIIFSDRRNGISAIDLLDGKLIWEQSIVKSGYFIKLVNDDKNLYLNDDKIKALDLKTGKIVWTDNSDEHATDNNNLIMASDELLITGTYYDEDGVIGLFNAKSGELLCNGRDMPNKIGFDQYTFYNFTQKPFFYAKDGGNHGYRIVRFELKAK